jgi:hypothetical protein
MGSRSARGDILFAEVNSVSIHVTGATSLTPIDTQRKLSAVNSERYNIFQYFWTSKPFDPSYVTREDCAMRGLDPKCVFLIQWNSNTGSEFIPEVPQILYRAFGVENLLMFDYNGDVIPPKLS